MSDNPFDQPVGSPAPQVQKNPFDYPTTQNSEPDMSGMQKYVQANLKDYREGQNTGGPGDEQTRPAPGQPSPQEASGFIDAFTAGLQMSTAGLAIRGKMPDTVLPQNASTAMNIVKNAGTVFGDLPAMVAGGVFGGAAGAAVASPALVVPGAGEVADAGAATYGAGMGAFAVPAAIRQYYIDQIQKGSVQNWDDFWTRTAAVGWQAAKAATVGAATVASGGLAAGALAKTAAPAIVQSGGTLASELGAMTTVGSAMEGHVPTANDFIQNAVLIGGFHSIAHVSELPSAVKGLQEKLQNIYADTGMKPADVGIQAASNPILKQELLSTSTKTPESLQSFKQDPGKNSELLGVDKPESIPAKIPEELNEPHPTMSDQFPDGLKPVIEKPETEEVEPKEKNEGNEPPSDKDVILSRIGEDGEKGPERNWDNWYTKTVDRLNPVNKFVEEATEGKSIPAEENPYARLSMAKSQAFARADEAINFGPRDRETGKPLLDEDGKPIPGMKEIVERFSKDPEGPNGFKAYLMGKRAIELAKDGRSVGIDLDASRRYVEENFDKYEASAEDFQKFANSRLDELASSGRFSQEQIRSIKEGNENYFPMRVDQGEGTGGNVSSSNPIKELHGSEKGKLDGFQSMIQQTYELYRIAEENRAKQTIVDLAAKNEVGSDLLKPVPIPRRGIELSESEVERQLLRQGIEADPFTMTVFRGDYRGPDGNQFAVYNEGKPSLYEVDPALAKSLQATAYTDPNLLMKIAEPFAKAQRIGITENPFFLLKHAIRDQFTAMLQSQNGYRIFYDGMIGISHYFAKSDDYMEFLRNGGGMSTFADFDKNYIQNDIWGISKETGMLDRMVNVVKTPWELQRVLAEATFTAPKMGEYLRAKEAGKTPYQSAYEARNVTVDIQKRGSDPLVNAWSAATPFFNMRIQGMDNMFKAFERDPKEFSTKLALGVIGPSLMTWYYFHNDSRYKNAPLWQKDLAWVFPTDKWEAATPAQAQQYPADLVRPSKTGLSQYEVNNGTVYRIPKPFEPGLAGSAIERTLDLFYNKNPDAFKGFLSAVFGDALPNVVPPAVMPAIEQFANRSYLSGSKIVPSRLEELAPAAQYTPYTTETAKVLGGLIGHVPLLRDIGHGNDTVASPIVVENYVRGWTGELGQAALQVLDKVMKTAGITNQPDKPTSALSDIPFVRGFVAKNPSMGAQPLQDFYDNYEKAKTQSNTFQAMLKSGDVKGAMDYRASAEANGAQLKLDGIAQALGAQHKAIQQIYLDPKMTPDDKKKLIEGTYYQMITEANYGNQLTRQYQEKVKNQ